MDLSKLKLDKEQATALQVMIDDEVKGLKDKNTELLGKFKEQKSMNESSAAKLKELEGLDIDGLKKMAAEAQSSQESDMLKKGQFSELMALKMNEQQAAFDAKIEAANQQATQYQNQLSKVSGDYAKTQIENAIRSGAGQVKDLHQSAVDDLVYRANDVWQLKDGHVQAYDGDKPLFKDGKPLQVGDWIEGMRDTAPHYFNKASGTGAVGGNGSGDDWSKYFKPETRDFTKQAELQKKDPAAYEKYHAEAQGATA